MFLIIYCYLNLIIYDNVLPNKWKKNIQELWLENNGKNRKYLVSLLEWEEKQKWRCILAIGKNVLTIRFLIKGVSYWGDSKIKSSNKILNNYSYGADYVDFNVKAGNWNWIQPWKMLSVLASLKILKANKNIFILFRGGTTYNNVNIKIIYFIQASIIAQ